jgi:hypothetical protein
MQSAEKGPNPETSLYLLSYLPGNRKGIGSINSHLDYLPSRCPSFNTAAVSMVSEVELLRIAARCIPQSFRSIGVVLLFT